MRHGVTVADTTQVNPVTASNYDNARACLALGDEAGTAWAMLALTDAIRDMMWRLDEFEMRQREA